MGTASIEFNATPLATSPLRGLSKAQENEITAGKVRVLVFDNNTKQFLYEAPVTGITPNTEDNKQTGTVKLLLKNTKGGTDLCTFVMLANVEPDNPASTEFTDKSVDAVMELFTFSMPETGSWSGGDLPMWGKISAAVNHDKGPNPKIGETIQLIRAVARIDVGLNVTKGQGDPSFDETAAGIDGITMTSVKFYNMNDTGTVAPASTNLEDNSTTKVKAPTIPDGAKALSTALDMSTKIQENKFLLQRSVYVPEAENNPANATQSNNGETHTEANQDNYMKRPYMVVGLKGADKSDKEKTTYFRIDFLKSDGAEATATYEYLPLLRNYRYLVNITNVGGPGFEKEEDAQKGPAANIMYNVVVWNESQMSDVKYDGQYMLGVSQDHFKFYREGGTLTAKVQTSWPKGFTVENLPKWITYSISEGGKITDEKIVTFKVTDHVTENRTYPESLEDAENALKAAYVQAGRMKWFLSFEQSKDLNVSIAIYSDPECTQLIEFIDINQYGDAYGTKENKWLMKDGEKLSAEQAGANVTFYVKTEPNLQPKISTKNHDKYKIALEGEMPGGIWKYQVTAPDITENDEFFDHVVSNYDFSIKHKDTGRSASMRLVLQQLEYNAIPYYDKSLTDPLVMTHEQFFFLMDGKPKQFHVKANAEYKIHLVSAKIPYGSGSVIEPFPDYIEDEPLMSGQPVDVTPINEIENPKFFEGVAIFEISSPLGLFPTREFKIGFAELGLASPSQYWGICWQWGAVLKYWAY